MVMAHPSFTVLHWLLLEVPTINTLEVRTIDPLDRGVMPVIINVTLTADE
jgi:hypothetical protein